MKPKECISGHNAYSTDARTCRNFAAYTKHEHLIALKMTAFWDDSHIIAVMKKAASTSETSVNFYQTTRRNNPEDSHLHSRRRKNLKSHWACFIYL
jgi:hypothetical protein